MNWYNMYFSSVLVIGIAIAGVISDEVILTPKTVDVRESESVALTVNYTGTEQVAFSKNKIEGFIILFENGTCVALGFINNKSLYTWNCLENTGYSITILKVDKEQHGDRWQCRIGISSLSNKVTINVKVPVKQVHIATNENIIKETEYKSFTCNTSHSRPKPLVKWFIKIEENKFHLKSTSIDSIFKDEKGFESAQNVLNVSFNRDKNGAELFCSGENGFGEVESNHIVLNITFPPSNPTFRYIDSISNETVKGNLINVIEGDEFILLCQSVGNPAPIYRWENEESGDTSIIIAGRSVNKTCTVTNAIGESRKRSASSTIFVNVLYAPTIPTVYMYKTAELEHNVSLNLRVIEKESFNLSCTSHGNPIPIYAWYVNSSEKSTDQNRVLLNISRHQSGLYTCKASNTMIRTFGEKKNGLSIRNTTLDVLYPAEVSDLTDMAVLEGSSIDVTCPILLGNPPQATVKWTPGGDLASSDSTRLYISNISRNDEKLYVCSVTTLMSPTYGLQKEEINLERFQLTVYCKARVTEFYIGAKTNKNVYTVNETEDVVFTCSIDSKPAPTATILLNDKIIYISDESSFTYRKENIQCTDFGLYECTGINEYNHGSQSVLNLSLYVNCSPRPSPFTVLKTNVTSARNTRATFSFTALAYPEPGPAGFMWSFMNGSDRMYLTNSTNVFILNTQSQSNLVIRNVSHADYRRYILRIRNIMGVFEQMFFLFPKDESPGQQQDGVSSNTRTFIGVGVGTFFAIIMIVAFILCVFRQFRIRSKQLGKTGDHVANRLPREDDDKLQYDQISMSTDAVNRRPNAGQEIGTSAYERISCSQRDRNIYSPLQTAYEQLDSVSREQNTYCTMEN